MNTKFQEVIYQKDFLKQRHCLLAGDIGGTNSNFGIFELRGTVPTLLFSLHTKSQDITDYAQLMRDILVYVSQKYQITIKKSCIGVAGVIEKGRNSVTPTNLSVTINVQDILQKTGLESVLLINDFEAVGLGIDCIAQQDTVTINKGKMPLSAQKACIGAGTGLGKAALLWNDHFKRYIPVASEGGHADFVVQSEQEFALFQFIIAERGTNCSVSWENVLSGNGIKLIYKFLESQKKYPITPISKEIESTGFMPDLISHYAQSDERCKDTFSLYCRLYARCAKNFVLDTLALAGIYIAGGIASKNINMFQEPQFMEEFTRCGRHSKLLEQVPVFVIADYNVSLYGAIVFMQLYEQRIL